MGDQPLALKFAQAKSRAHPVLERLSVGPCAAALNETVSERHVMTSSDFEIVNLEETWAFGSGLPLVPTFSIRICPFVLHRGQYIEDRDVRRMVRQYFVIVPETGCGCPFL